MLRPKPHIERLQAPVHGSIGFLPHIPVSEEQVLDFSTCCNPYKPPRQVVRAAANADLGEYPDPEARQLVNSLSGKLRLAAENIIAGSGSTELLRMTAMAYFGQGSSVVIPSPTYGEYELACRIVDARVISFRMSEDKGFRLDANEFISFTRPHKPAGIFICNPNNPTGQYLTRREIESIIKAFPSALIVLDEAYLAFTVTTWDSLSLLKSGNLLIVRSLTKDYALAGLRLGYAIASPRIITALKKVRPPWNVNSPAQKSGLAALECSGYLAESCLRVELNKNYLTGSLSSLGYQVVGTQTNFFLVRTGNAALLRQKLLLKNILVRDCTSFGLPQYIRIAPRNLPDCRKLVKAFKELAEGKA